MKPCFASRSFVAFVAAIALFVISCVLSDIWHGGLLSWTLVTIFGHTIVTNHIWDVPIQWLLLTALPYCWERRTPKIGIARDGYQEDIAYADVFHPLSVGIIATSLATVFAGWVPCVIFVLVIFSGWFLLAGIIVVFAEFTNLFLGSKSPPGN